MQAIHLDLNDADRVQGQLYGRDNPDLLTDDMLLVRVGAYGVDVSWYPEHDPEGEYVITVFRKTWHNKIWEHRTRDENAVAQFVEQQLQRLSQPYVPTSAVQQPSDVIQEWGNGGLRDADNSSCSTDELVIA